MDLSTTYLLDEERKSSHVAAPLRLPMWPAFCSMITEESFESSDSEPGLMKVFVRASIDLRSSPDAWIYSKAPFWFRNLYVTLSIRSLAILKEHGFPVVLAPEELSRIIHRSYDTISFFTPFPEANSATALGDTSSPSTAMFLRSANVYSEEVPSRNDIRISADCVAALGSARNGSISGAER